MNFAMADLLLAADTANSKSQATHDMREAEKAYRDTVNKVSGEQSKYTSSRDTTAKITRGIAGLLGYAVCGPPCAGIGNAVGNAVIDIGYDELGLFGGEENREALEDAKEDLQEFNWTVTSEGKKWQADRVNAWEDRMFDVQEQSMNEVESWESQVGYNESFTASDALRYGINAVGDYTTGEKYSKIGSEFLGFGDFEGLVTKHKGGFQIGDNVYAWWGQEDKVVQDLIAKDPLLLVEGYDYDITDIVGALPEEEVATSLIDPKTMPATYDLWKKHEADPNSAFSNQEDFMAALAELGTL